MIKDQVNAGILGGNALPATIYVLVYSLWTISFAFHLNVNLIRISYVAYYGLTAWYIYSLTRSKGSSKFLKALTIMFVLTLIYGALLIITGTSGWKRDASPSGFFLQHFASIIPIYVFYYFGKRGMLSTKWFQIMFVLFCVDAYALYYEKQQYMMDMMLVNEMEFTNNIGYVIVSLLPLIAFFNNKRIIQYVALVLISISTVICFKRGAILVGLLAIFYFLFNSLRTVGRTNKIILFFVGAMALIVLYRYVDHLFLSNDYFYNRLTLASEGDSSGRDDIYSFFGRYLLSVENGIGILIGNGATATVRLLGIEAHNDWLEYAIDMGLIGVSAYLFYWITIYKYYKDARKHMSNEVVLAMGMVLIINFARTFFSMSFNDMSFFSALLIGYTMSLVDSYRHTNNVSLQLTT